MLEHTKDTGDRAYKMNYAMKKTLCVFAVLYLLIACMTVYAESQTYSLPELGCSVEMPVDYIVITRQADDDDAKLAEYGYTREEFTSFLIGRDMYLNGWDTDAAHEVVITMTENDIADFNAFSDSTLAFLTTTLEEEYKNLGITVEDTEIYQHEQAKFIKLYISQPNGSMIAYGLQYYTIYNNKAINITMHSYVGPLTAEDEALLSDIVDSTYFDTASAVTEPTTSPSAPDSNKDRAVSDRFRFENILFALLITIALYALPIVIYRYAVRKSPVPSGAAKIITGLYGVFSFLLTLIILNKSQWVISGGAIVLWSYVNYRLLRAGKKTDDNCGTDCINDSAAQERTEGEDTYEQTNSQTEGKMLFCRNCGTPLSVESEYCHKCGTKSH